MTAQEIEEKLLKENPNATMADLLRVLPDKERKSLQNTLKQIFIENLLGPEKDHNDKDEF